MQSVSVEAVLKRGFAWVRNQDKKTVYSSEQARSAREIEIRFYDGSVKTGISAEPTKAKPAKGLKQQRNKDERQTDLFDF